MSTVRQAFRFALDPTDAQLGALASHAGGARFAHNWALARVKADMEAKAADPSHASVSWSAYALRKAFNAEKDTAAPWWAANSKEAYNTGFASVATALDNWKKSKAGTRGGSKMGFPRFKRRGGRDSVRFTTGVMRCGDDNRSVVLPRLGRIRTCESTRKLTRRVAAGTARITSATVTRTAGRWFVSFAVEVDRSTDVSRCAANQSHTTVGVDLGVSTFAVCSDGQTFTSPRPLEIAQRRLRRLNKELSRRQKGSANRAKTGTRLARQHARIANIRNDFTHKVTTRLARTKQTIVVEDLHVTGMLRNHRLARHIADQGWGEFRRQLTYKAQWYGSNLVVADRFYASSKTCSSCGLVDQELTLSDRTYRCGCGLVLDRDLNAARNLAAWGNQVIAGSASEMPNACGGNSAGPDLGPGETDPCEAGTNQPSPVAA